MLTGLWTAVGLVQAGYRVVISARTTEAAAHAKETIARLSRVTESVEALLVDFSDLDAVRAFAEAFKATFDRVGFADCPDDACYY